MLEKTLESPLHQKEIKAVIPKRNQSWIFIGRTDAKAPILWPPDSKNWLLGKDSDVGKHWRQEEKGMPEEEMVGRHHWLDGHEFEQAPGVGNGQGSLARCSPLGHKELDMSEPPNWTDLFNISHVSYNKNKFFYDYKNVYLYLNLPLKSTSILRTHACTQVVRQHSYACCQFTCQLCCMNHTSFSMEKQTQNSRYKEKFRGPSYW